MAGWPHADRVVHDAARGLKFERRAHAVDINGLLGQRADALGGDPLKIG